MYNLDMNNFFTRWSVNLFGLMGTSSIFICYFATMLYVLLAFKNESISSYGDPIFFLWCFSVIVFQAIIFFATIFLLIKELNSNFRIKKRILLKICNNIFYKIIISILIIFEFLLLIISFFVYKEFKF